MRRSNAKRLLILGTTILAIVAVATTAFLTHHTTTHAATGAQQMTLQNITATGTGSFGSGSVSLAGDGLHDATAPDIDRDQHTNAKAPANAPTVVPNPAPNAIASSNPGFSGFSGLTHVDTRSADGGNAFSLEPPDQGLCVGNGNVIEAVNDIMVVFDKQGHRLTTPTSMNTFFGLPYAINRTTGARGPFLSDPKCLYDAPSGRFFLTVLEEDAAPSVRAHTLIAVSQSSNPAGKWSLFSIDATDDGLNGTPSNPGCPCFGDQPLIGANADGFYISTNEFGAGFNGAQVYAMSKSGLVAAANANSGALPKVVHINAGTLATPDVGGIWYSIQPATTPAGAANGQGQIKNTEYFLSALQFGPAPLDNRIAVWSLENTSALVSGNPMAVTLSNTVISSETYGQPPNALQKAGPRPLGDALGEPENQLNGNDDRMNQVVYANGMLWSGVNTVISGNRVGIAYFVVSPKLTGHGLSASMASQGYVSAAGESVLFPSIGVNNAGQGVMTFSLSGPDYYPSAAYTTISATAGAGSIHIAGAGTIPADGFTGYPEYGGNGVERWGDYSAAVTDTDGSIWMAAEYIPGGPRTALANWGTFISHVTP